MPTKDELTFHPFETSQDGELIKCQNCFDKRGLEVFHAFAIGCPVCSGDELKMEMSCECGCCFFPLTIKATKTII